MNNIFFLSDSRNGFYEELANEFRKDIKENSNIVIISANPDDDIKSDKKKNNLLNQFKDIGIEFNDSIIITNSTDIEYIIEKIDKADVLFLHGGNHKKQFELIKNKNLINKIKDFSGVVIGVSAGSINLSKISLMVPLIGYDEYSILDKYNGINICGINVFPHFNIESFSDELINMSEDEVYKMNDLLAVLKGVENVYCLPDKCSLKICNNELSILDDYCYLYNDNELKKREAKLKLLLKLSEAEENIKNGDVIDSYEVDKELGI